jgi:hypothetical protein
METIDVLYFKVLKILRRMWLRKRSLAADKASNGKPLVKLI